LGFEVVLFSDMGETKSTRVEKLCGQYGVRRETTSGYSPAHNAFVERWFRTNAEMSRCQMLQYDTYETYWENSRRMATFNYNRVSPARKITEAPWTTALKKQYPERKSMDMIKIKPFGIICCVYHKKPIRNKGSKGIPSTGLLFSDMGEAKSTRVEELCGQYGVRRETISGYSPAHNAFVERWFRTNAEMSRCQMLQYDTDESYWENSRRMATFNYNRVPQARKIPGSMTCPKSNHLVSYAMCTTRSRSGIKAFMVRVTRRRTLRRAY
jgi:transposase InsO family protein